MALLYQGYAQAKGFQQIDPHDSTPEKIRQQGLENLRNQEKSLEWRTKLANQRSNDLKATMKKQAQNRLDVEQFRRDVRDQNFQREVTHQQSLIDRAAQKQVNQENQLKQLLAFTETGAKWLGEREGKRRAAKSALFKEAVNKYGLDTNTIQVLNQSKKGVQGISSAQQGAINKLRANGMPEDMIRQLHGMPLWLQIAVKEGDAIRRTRQLPFLIKQLGNQPLKLGDTTITYNSAKASGDQVKFETAKRLLQKHIVTEIYGGVDIDAKVKETSGSYRVENAIWAQEAREGSVHAASVAKEQAAEEIRVIWSHQLDQPDLDENNLPTGSNISVGQAYLNTINLVAGEGASGSQLALAREQVDAMLIHDLEFGIGNITEDVKQLISDRDDAPTFKFNNGAVKSIADQWPKTILKLEKALHTRLQHDNATASLSLQAYKIKQQNAKLEALDYVYGEGEGTLDEQGLMNLMKGYNEKGYTEASTVIQNYLVKQMGGGDDIANMVLIQSRINRNEEVTLDMIRLMAWNNPTTKKTAQALVNKHNMNIPTVGENGTKKILDAWIKASLLDKLPTSRSQSLEDPNALSAVRSATRKGVTHYKTFMIEKEANHDKALEYAQQQLHKEFSDPVGEFRVKRDKKTKAMTFVHFIPGDSNLIKFNAETQIKAIKKDDSYIDNNLVLPVSMLREKANALQKGFYPDKIYKSEMISRDTGVSTFDLETRQIKYINNNLEEGEAPIPEYPGWYIKNFENQTKDMSPQAVARLNATSQSSINRAYLDSGKAMPYIDHSIKKVSTIVKESLTDSYGGYNNLDIDGADQHSSDIHKGINLVNTTLHQAVVLGGPNGKLGAYKIPVSMIEPYVKKAGLTMNSPFNKINQDKLFELIYRDKGVQFILPELSREFIDGTTLTSPEDLEFIESTYKAITSDKFEVSQWRNPAFMHKDVTNIYRSMGVAANA